MEKNFTTRNNKRDNGLGSIDAIWKVLTEIFWAKKGGKEYSVTAICRDNHIRRMKTDIVESLYDWSYAPTRELAEKMHQIICRHESENWGKKKDEAAEPAEEDTARRSEFTHVFKMDDGHMYMLTRID